jgi:uncharacterized protein YbjT (DUF2867 family)
MSGALHWAPQLRGRSLARAPFTSAPIAAIDPSYIAAVAMTALGSAGHVSRSYALSGPEPMLPATTSASSRRVLGGDLRFEAQPDALGRR